MKYILLLLLISTPILGDEEWRDKIVLIDTGLDSMEHIELCRGNLHKDFTSTGLVDNVDHGNQVFRIVTEGMNVGKYCVVIIKWIDTARPTDKTNDLINIIRYVSSINPKFVNMSMSGSSYMQREESIIRKMAYNGTSFFIAAGNDSRNLGVRCNVYPACYDVLHNYNVVGALDQYGEKLRSTNFSGPVNDYELGTYEYHSKVYQGTSFAAPKALSKELR